MFALNLIGWKRIRLSGVCKCWWWFWDLSENSVDVSMSDGGLLRVSGVDGMVAATHLLCLTVVVKCIKVRWWAKAWVQICRGYRWCHPLMVCKKCQKGLPACLRVVPVSPVGVHEFDGLPEYVLAFRVAIKVVHEAGHGVVKVIGLDTIFIVHNQLHKLQALALIDSKHDVIVEELPLKEKYITV